jgi:hypothetical protein
MWGTLLITELSIADNEDNLTCIMPVIYPIGPIFCAGTELWIRLSAVLMYGFAILQVRILTAPSDLCETQIQPSSAGCIQIGLLVKLLRNQTPRERTDMLYRSFSLRPSQCKLQGASQPLRRTSQGCSTPGLPQFL